MHVWEYVYECVCVCVCTQLYVGFVSRMCACLHMPLRICKGTITAGGYMCICVSQNYWHLWGCVTKLIKRRRPSHPVGLAAGQQARRMSFVILNCNLHEIKDSDKETAISNRTVQN